MRRRESKGEKQTWRRAIAMLVLAIAFAAGIAGMGAAVYAESIPKGAFDPGAYQGTAYTICGHSESHQTGEIEKLYTNIFYYKDTIVVEDTNIKAHGRGGGSSPFTFNLVSYDAQEEASSGFATLKTLEDEGIIRITKGVMLDGTLGEKVKGKTTIAKIEFINPNYMVKLCSSRSNSPHPSWSGQTTAEDHNTYLGIITNIDHAAVYAVNCDLTYSYSGSESDYLWQDGAKSRLPEKLYAPMPQGSYTFTIPLPAGSGCYTDINDDNPEAGSRSRFGAIVDISYEDASTPVYLTERIGTIAPRKDHYDNDLQGSTYRDGKIQILGSTMNIEFYTYQGATVTFHQNGGTIKGIADGNDCYVKRVLYPHTYTAAEIDAFVDAPSRDGYRFAGWGFTNPYDYTNIQFGDFVEVQPGYYQALSYEFLNGNPPFILDMYALWTPVSSAGPTDTADLSREGTVTVKDQVYTGKELRPAVTVKVGKKKLVRGTDYTVSYKNNKAVGTAAVTVKGKGGYTGTLKKTFKINPKPVPLSGLTAGKKQLTVRWKKGKEVTGYEIQYSVNKKFPKKKTKTVTVTPAKTVKKVIKKLTRGKTYHVRIRTYKTVSKVKYYSAWSKVKKTKIK